MTVYHELIICSLLLVSSFFFNLVQKRIQIPAVILLISLGMLLNIFNAMHHVHYIIPKDVVQVFGILGMIVIVLEAVMDTKIGRHNLRLCWFASITALVLLVLHTICIAIIFVAVYDMHLYPAIIYAIPLSIMSSAIVLPSLTGGNSHLGQLLIFEAVISDIIGILLFNFLTVHHVNSVFSLFSVFTGFIVMCLISLVTTLIISFILSKKQAKNLHVFILAVLVLIFSLAKTLHLSALILILLFGLFLNNFPKISQLKPFKQLVPKYLAPDIMATRLEELQILVDELGFIIRSAFFVMLGYSLTLGQIFNLKVIAIGSAIIITIYIIRLIFFTLFISRHHVLYSSLIMPRGLVTVLLFFQIPSSMLVSDFNEGIITFVIVVTTLIMSFAEVLVKHKAMQEPITPFTK